MTFESQRDLRREPAKFLPHLIVAVCTGAIAGIAVATLDAAAVAARVGPTWESLEILGLGSGILATAAALLGGAATGAVLLGAWLSRHLGAARRRLAPWIEASAAALCLAPFISVVSVRLFQGGRMSRLPGKALLIALTIGLLVVLAVVIARGVLAAIRWSAAGVGRRRAIAVASGAAALAVAFHVLDSCLYSRLYLYLHDGLAAAGLGAMLVAVRVLRLPVVPRRRRAAMAMFLVIALAGVFGWCGATLGRRASLKAMCMEHASSLAAVLRHLPAISARPPRDQASLAGRSSSGPSSQVVAQRLPAAPGASIVLISIDALRADRWGIYGHTERDLTPNLDEWAGSSGVVFERAYCPAPHSSYSITSLHTSRFLYQEAALSLPVVHPTLAEVLGQAGYRSEAFYTQGIFFTEGERVGGYRSSQFGFDKAHHGAPDAAQLTDYAIAAVDEMAAADRPSFLWVHYFNVHEPYRSTTFGTSAADRYDGEVAEADAAARRLIDYATQRLGDRLVIAITADHGEEFKDHGGDYHGSSLYDEQVRVPLVIAAPGVSPGRIRGQVSTVSIAATLLGLVGITPPASMIGEDLRPAMMTGESPGKTVFSAVHRKQAAVRAPYKLIVDPALGTAELFDLVRDPKERVNLYDTHEGVAQELERDLYAFMAELGQARTWEQAAINLGRLRDPRAASELLRLAADPAHSTEQRLAALELLAGLADADAAASLAALLEQEDDQIATAAALVLSSLQDPRGAGLLRDALFDQDSQVRDKAALALATMRDRSAVPTLIETLGRADMEMRQEAIRALGELRDPEAVEALTDLLGDMKSKYLVVLALGKIGGPRAFDTLRDVLATETYSDVRGYAVLALGWLEDPRAVPLLREVLRHEPEIKWTAESLVRLKALGRGGLFGVDARPGEPALLRGFGECAVRPRILASEFLGRTTCRTTGPQAELEVRTDFEGPAQILVSARHLVDAAEAPVGLTVAVDGRAIGRVELTAELRALSLATPAGTWSRGRHRVTLRLEAQGLFELDHFIVHGGE